MPVSVKHNQNDAFQFLKKHKVGVLATVDPNGEPHAAAIYFNVEDGKSITFMTKTGTKKADNLRHNNHAVLVVYEASSQTTVQLTGTTEEVSDLHEANAIFGQVMNTSTEESNTPVPPISRLQEGDYVAYRLNPAETRMAVFNKPDFGNFQDLFQTETPN